MSDSYIFLRKEKRNKEMLFLIFSTYPTEFTPLMQQLQICSLIKEKTKLLVFFFFLKVSVFQLRGNEGSFENTCVSC